MLKTVVGLGMVAVLSGCGSVGDLGGDRLEASNEVVGQTSAAIIGGDETSDYPAVVAIAILIPDASAPGGFKQGLCTGTLVAKDASSTAPSDRVLTAAHCVDPALTGSTETKFIVVARDGNLTDGIEESNKYPVKAYTWNKLFDSKNVLAGNDVAVLTLERPVEGIQPIPYNRTPLAESFQGSTLVSVGFGLNDGLKQEGAGIKRVGDAYVSSTDASLIRLGQFFKGDRICQGDSGGPVLATVNNQLTVVGIHSFGFIFCVGQGNATNVGTHTDFIDTEVSATH